MAVHKNRLNLKVVYKTTQKSEIKSNKMNPSQAEKNIRRYSSSILKGPKSRNPLESLEPAPSSTETTPSRLKRRVSFAEKKHVKEFCDSMEQGTVWDNTYEESDSSHITRSHHDENAPRPPQPVYVPSLNDSDSSLIFERRRPPVLNLNFVGPHVIEQHPELLPEKENIPMSAIADLAAPEDEVISPPNFPQVIPPSSQKFAIYCDDEGTPSPPEKAKSFSADDSEDRTRTLTDSQCLDLTDNGPEREGVISSKLPEPPRSAFDGMEMTEALTSVLSSMTPRNKTQDINGGVDSTETITSVLAHKSIWSILHDEDTDDTLSSSQNIKATEGVSSVVNDRGLTRTSVLNLDGLRSSGTPGETQFFHQTVDMAGHVPSVLDSGRANTGVLNSDGMEMTEAITPFFPGTEESLDQSGMELTRAIDGLQPTSTTEDRTQYFPREMEMTETISRLPSGHQSEERTQFFHLGEMEMTKAVSHRPAISQPEERTRFFHQGEMEMTEAVNHRPAISQPEERTQFFHQGEMEMTEAVNHRPAISQPEERTQFFHQGEMEMTEAITRRPPMSQPEERTQFFHQGEMEITETVNRQLTISQPEERTQFFHQGEMEMTEAVNCQPAIGRPEERTQFFHQGEMEMTEAISRQQLASQPEDRTKFFHEGEMEMTEAINRQPAISRPEERTQFFHQGEMEMTEAINRQPAISRPEEKTQLFQQGEMEMTEAVSCPPAISQPEERTQFFYQGEMEMTEAVNRVELRSEPEDRTKFFHQEEMEMTDAINRRKPASEPEDRTQCFHQGEMELTEAINHQQWTDEPDETTQLFCQGGMEMTEVVRPQAQLQNSVMEFTEAIPSLKRPHGTMSTGEGVDSATSSPRLKSSKQYVPFPHKTPSKQDRDALHRLLHPDSPELSSPDLHNPSTKVPTTQDHRRLYSEINSPQLFIQNRRESSITTCNFTAHQGHTPSLSNSSSQHPSNTLNHLQYSPPNLANQSMEFTCPVRPQQLGRFATIRRDDSMKTTESHIPVSARRTKLDDGSMPEAGSTSIPAATDPSDSSDSFKENRTPPGERPRLHPVARPLFDKQNSELSDSTPTPLEDSEEPSEAIRSKPVINGRNLENVTLELTEFIAKPVEDPGILSSSSSSDLQNVEAPSFLFAVSVNESSVAGINKSDEGRPLRLKEPTRHLEEALPYQDEGLGDQEMTCDLRPVPIPEVEFTEEISNFEARRRTRVLQMKEEEEIARKRRTYNIPNESPRLTSAPGEQEIAAADRRRTHTVRRHEEGEREVIQRVENSKTYVIVNQSSRESVEVDGQVRIEAFDKNSVVTSREDQQTNDAGGIGDAVLDKCQWWRSDDYKIQVVDDEVNVEFDIRERETCSATAVSRKHHVRGEFGDGGKERGDTDEETSDHSLEHPLDHKEEVEIPEKLRRQVQIVREHDALVKAIKKSRKAEEMLRLKTAKMRDKSPESSPEVPGPDPLINEDQVELSPFEAMKQSLEKRASTNCMWTPVRILEERVFVEFKKTGFTFGATFIVPEDGGGMERIRSIYKLPVLAASEPPILKMTDRLIEDRINVDELKKKFRTYDDVLPLIETVTEDVKFIYDFYEELRRMSRLNSMEITLDRVSFLVKTTAADTILEVFMNIKSFSEIGPDDIDVKCLLGSVSKSDIKNLVKNVKKNHKFITVYMNDVKDYIELMEMASMK